MKCFKDFFIEFFVVFCVDMADNKDGLELGRLT